MHTFLPSAWGRGQWEGVLLGARGVSLCDARTVDEEDVQ